MRGSIPLPFIREKFRRKCYSAFSRRTWTTSLLAFSAVFFGAAASVSAQVIISEIMYVAPGNDAHQEWVELFNSGTTAVDIRSWKINDGSNHVLNAPPKNGGVGSTIIAPSGYLIIAADAAQFRSIYPSAANVVDTTLSLPNSGGTISLQNGSTVQDSVSYDSSIGAAGDGNTLNRISAGVFLPRRPSPGAPTASDAIPPPAPKVIPQKVPKVSKKKSTSVSVSRTPTIISSSEAVSDVTPSAHSTDVQDPPSAVTNPVPETQTAAAASSVSWWWVGAALLAFLGAGALFFSRGVAKHEWDIVEEKE